MDIKGYTVYLFARSSPLQEKIQNMRKGQISQVSHYTKIKLDFMTDGRKSIRIQDSRVYELHKIGSLSNSTGLTTKAIKSLLEITNVVIKKVINGYNLFGKLKSKTSKTENLMLCTGVT